MVQEKTTLIQISTDTWRKLNQMKELPNESFDIVIKRMIKQNE